ncbi:cytochrome b/b6 domain-containing protein [Pseudomonas sp. LA21]|uniref:cytochrome b n=1 Tax=unclassified Pseudomonas TaxID=196821 RepID=UPI001FB7A2F9|nr:cytochrome b/b6 domain-containing protein [Pseudomonas sp. LA21]MCJ1887187.1 cytochrome b/b6 domain-containing protein [Pseudomonas sp. LA21]
MKPTYFPLSLRVFHWLMAPLVLAMLLIGLGMVASVSPRHAMLVAIHKPLGAALLVLVLLRIAIRLTHRVPPLPNDMPGWQRGAAHLSHLALYGLLLAQPLVGWTMQSAGGYPVVLWGGFELPALVSPSVELHTVLRGAHSLIAYALLLTILLHLAAALFHGLIRRDAVLPSMTGAPMPNDPAGERP